MTHTNESPRSGRGRVTLVCSDGLHHITAATHNALSCACWAERPGGQR